MIQAHKSSPALNLTKSIKIYDDSLPALNEFFPLYLSDEFVRLIKLASETKHLI